MEIEDIADEDLKFVEAARKRIRINRRLRWLFLAVGLGQIVLAVWLGRLIQKVLHDAIGLHYAGHVAAGMALGFIFGLFLAALAVSAGWSLVGFLAGLIGSKQDRLLVKYFEIATGRKEARDLITSRSP